MDILDFRVRPRTDWYYKDLYPNPIPEFARYITLYNAQHLISLTTFEDSIVEMKASGVTKGVIFGGKAEDNEIVAETVRKYPENYVGLAGVRPDFGIAKALKDLEYAFTTLGLRGLNMSPYLTGLYPADARNYPLYAMCDEMGMCVVSHSSVHYNPGKAIDFGDPRHLDKVAVDFPNLKIVMAHAGFGFGELGLMVANRHDNMFIDFTGLHPRSLTPTHIGMINGPLRYKAIFGTNFPCLNYPVVEEYKKIVKESAQPYFFYKNGARALGIE